MKGWGDSISPSSDSIIKVLSLRTPIWVRFLIQIASPVFILLVKFAHEKSGSMPAFYVYIVNPSILMKIQHNPPGIPVCAYLL
jgi:hypothetical protein